MSPLPATQAGDLHAELRTMIVSSRQRLTGAVNVELTRLYWTVGQRLGSEVQSGERASYGAQLLAQLGQQLSQEFGRGFEARNLRRMVRFSHAFPDAARTSTRRRGAYRSYLVSRIAPRTGGAAANAQGWHHRG